MQPERMAMLQLKLAIHGARCVAIQAQVLDGRRKLPRSQEGIARVTVHLGYVQMDAIAVINRVHCHHNLWTRRPFHSQVDVCPASRRQHDHREAGRPWPRREPAPGHFPFSAD